ncbi:MurR/RpiR family transcriptional regulator [Pseudooceanicola sp. 502str34]|uniref:MurR/RpiR family transcriptional regulator n=1 Tax=Maritimibacter alkaliphilus TaxID=404236 RepID=UPI001C9576B3|nr:MurR/RpiR family transcriptional regulator [Maritimibacter alkaliphilus]MBY6089301.1 MurR/RpiR family transcriptional regulator [Maritimibacter alkaliphilus]
MKIRDLLSGGAVTLTPSEEKIAQVLLTDYPTSGLGTAASLAKKAGVSDPTVNRLVVKLGFDGYPAFQSRLLEEIEDRLRSPLSMMESRPTGGDSPARAYLQSARKALEESETSTPQASYDRAARLIMEARQVLLVGGRFSTFLGGILAGHLEQFRAGVTALPALSAPDYDRLVDLTRRDLVVTFDYRRYQSDVIAFTEQAAATGARVVLFTDRWRSPAATSADVVLVSPVEVQSPYDTMVPALGQIEALVAQLLAEYGPEVRRRIERIEAVRSANNVTRNG